MSPSCRKSSPSTSSLWLKVWHAARTLEEVLGLPEQVKRLPEPPEMLVATILSQNTIDVNSHRAYTALRERYPSWEEPAAAPTAAIKRTIRVGGLATRKSVLLKQALLHLKARFGQYDLSQPAGMSDDEVIAELIRIKGIGAKTAACVLLFSLRRDVCPVDTHVHRVCTRLGLVVNGTTPAKTFEVLRSVVPCGKDYSFHTNLIRYCAFEENHLHKRGKAKSPRGKPEFMLLDNVRVA